jgi:hypothetical protein
MPLTVLPEGSTLRGVTALPVAIEDRPAVRVELLDDLTYGVYGVDNVDKPTFAILPIEVLDGVIEVDVRSRLNGKGPAEARAFAGLAFRIRNGGEAFECVYVRPLNGRKVDAPPIRHERAVQWFAYPDWPFDRLREAHPGRYEAGADIGPDEWLRLRVEFSGRRVTATIDGVEVLSVESLVEPAAGRVGLFVDIGTEAYFANLIVRT